MIPLPHCPVDPTWSRIHPLLARWIFDVFVGAEFSLPRKKSAQFPLSLRKNYFPDSIGIHKAEFCSARMDPVASYGEAVSGFYLLFCG